MEQRVFTCSRSSSYCVAGWRLEKTPPSPSRSEPHQRQQIPCMMSSSAHVHFSVSHAEEEATLTMAALSVSLTPLLFSVS